MLAGANNREERWWNGQAAGPASKQGIEADKDQGTGKKIT